MIRHPFIKTCWVLFAALFLSVQGLSQAHAAANGGIDHTHDGVACDVALIAAEQAVITPPTIPPTTACLPSRAMDYVAATPPAHQSFDSRAPPPRGPPL